MTWANAFERSAVAAAVQTAFSRPDFVRAKLDLKSTVTIDFETYWDDAYTLKKMSTSEYIRDPRFKAHMMGIKIGKGKTKVVPAARIKTVLRSIDWTCHDLLCHNTAFDGFILSHHFGVIPRRYYDTLSMARGLHSNDIGASLDEVAQYYGVGNKIPNVLEQSSGIRNLPKQLYADMSTYCAMDVELTIAILQLMAADFPADEMALIDITIRMFCDPVLKVDIPRVQKEYERELQRKKDLLLSIADAEHDGAGLLKGKVEKALVGEERTLLIAKRIVGSSERFANLLRAEGVEPPIKISPAWIKAKPAEREDSKKWIYAFSKDDLDFQELLDHESERVRDLCECRLSVKSTTNITRAERFLKAGANGMSLPVGLAYFRAHTGRWGGNNKMNMQNLKRGGELRASILAPHGYMIVVCDSGQIECRVNGWLWGQDDLMEAFAQADAGIGSDAYCIFASLVYGREITKADKLERHVGKTSVLGLGFQMGAEKFKNTLAKGANGGPPVHFDDKMVNKIVQTYRRKNFMIVAGWNRCKGIIEDMAAGRTGSWKCLTWEKETIWLPNGMRLHYPDLKKSTNEESGYDEWSYRSKTGRKKIYGGLLCENIVQALARIIVGVQMLEISKDYRVVMMTHDESVTIAPKRSAPKCYQKMLKAMRTQPSWCKDLPLNAEGEFAVNYS